MKKKRLIVVHPDKNPSDWTEKSQAFLAQKALARLRRTKTNQRLVEVVGLHHSQIVEALKPAFNISLIALHGHGKQADGSLMDSKGNLALTPRDRRLLSDRSVFAFYCFSSRLFFRIRRLPKPTVPSHFVGLRDQLWLVSNRAGQTYKGFHESAFAALQKFLKTKSARHSAMQLQEEASSWITQWLCTLILSSMKKDSVGIRTSFICCLGLLTINSNVFFYDKE